MARPYEIKVEDAGGRAADGELRRLQRFWLRVVALAVADQDAEWIGGSVSGRNLILEAAGIEPDYWDRVMRPPADAIRTERERAKLERGRPDRSRLVRSNGAARGIRASGRPESMSVAGRIIR